MAGQPTNDCAAAAWCDDAAGRTAAAAAAGGAPAPALTSNATLSSEPPMFCPCSALLAVTASPTEPYSTSAEAVMSLNCRPWKGPKRCAANEGAQK